MNKTAAMILAQYEDAEPKAELLRLRTANECLNDASARPIPGMLFSEFWHEGELCILFADTNVGKSILAVQIAERIGSGTSDGVFRVDTAAQQVLYLDFELSDKQFEKRYSDDFTNHYAFHPNLYRIEINTDAEVIVNFEQELEEAIIRAIEQTGARVMLVDNITYLKTQSTETAKDAVPLMRMLSRLKRKYSMSILALAHTPKRNSLNELSVNDLAGSKQLSNFADSIFAIGQSMKDNSLRYLKQIKSRATEKIYDSDYVMLCRIEKHINFLGFTQVGFDRELNHLKQRDTKSIETQEQQVCELYRQNPDVSLREIARMADMPCHTRVKRILIKHGLISS